MSRFRSRLIGLPLLPMTGAAALGLLIGLGERSTSINEFVSSWQTLIAGLVAAGAAYATIQKMDETDRNAADRQIQIIAVQLASERLRLVRARQQLVVLHRDINRIKRMVASFQEMATRVRAARVADDWLSEPDSVRNEYRKLVLALNDIRIAAVDVTKTLHSDPMTEAKSLFELDVSEALNAVVTFANAFMAPVVPRIMLTTGLWRLDDDPSVWYQTSVDDITDGLDTLARDAQTLGAATGDFASRLDQTIARYPVPTHHRAG